MKKTIASVNLNGVLQPPPTPLLPPSSSAAAPDWRPAQVVAESSPSWAEATLCADELRGGDDGLLCHYRATARGRDAKLQFG